MVHIEDPIVRDYFADFREPPQFPGLMHDICMHPAQKAATIAWFSDNIKTRVDWLSPKVQLQLDRLDLYNQCVGTGLRDFPDRIVIERAPYPRPIVPIIALVESDVPSRCGHVLLERTVSQEVHNMVAVLVSLVGAPPETHPLMAVFTPKGAEQLHAYLNQQTPHMLK